MERALLVTIKIRSEREVWHLEEVASELEELAITCGVEIVDNITSMCDRPTPNYFIGKGKTEELAVIAQEENIDVVIFSHDLSGVQQRNLEEVIGKKIIDRTQLILHIFAKHAHTPEGKLQVELAQLQYLMPRLIGKGLILSRTGGGIGTSGPGETRLETDRRRIREKLDKLRADLKQVTVRRETSRKRRKDNAIPSVALVGYTNAGKSTLLNALTQSNQVVSNGLFTTLDPVYKSLQLPGGENIIISDTVGFLHNLPHHLVEAFKATLEGVMEADLLIHVLDVSSPHAYELHKAVIDVLKELKAESKPMITALNKIDLLENKELLNRYKKDFINPVAISAKSHENLDILLKNIQENFADRMVDLKLELPAKRMDLLNLFYREGKVKEVKYIQDKIKIQVSLPKILYNKLLSNKEIQ